MPRGELICEGCGQYESECRCPREKEEMEAKSYSEETIVKNPYPDKKDFNAQREAWEDGFKAGEKKVVEWIETHKSNPQGSTTNPDYTVYLGYEWQSKLKEWGIECKKYTERFGK